MSNSPATRTEFDDEIDDAIKTLIDADSIGFWVQAASPPRHGESIVHVTGYDRDELSVEDWLRVSQTFLADHLAIAARHSHLSVDEVAAATVAEVKDRYATAYDPDDHSTESVPPLVEAHERNGGTRE